MKNILTLNLFLCLIILFGCSATEETQKEEGQKEIYVFDDVEELDTLKNQPAIEAVDSARTIVQTKQDTLTESKVKPDSIAESKNPEYIIQVGAFSTKERAEQFIKENQIKTEFQLKLSFSEQVHLHVIQLAPFITREDAEAARDRLLGIPAFKGAFIITKYY
ncbi:MAG: SPOR domain-containing protein [Bacteroidota bacterium]